MGKNLKLNPGLRVAEHADFFRFTRSFPLLLLSKVYMLLLFKTTFELNYISLVFRFIFEEIYASSGLDTVDFASL